MSKDKWVRRFSVDETARHKNKFTIYKITSVLFPISSPEVVTVVSVWKRYSDVQILHESMRMLHAGLHLRGNFPKLPKFSYFKRFQPEVIEERARVIKAMLEFIAEHQLLFTSTDFVNFLQTGYPEPENTSGVINAIRSSLHLPMEESPPLEYQTDDDDTRSPEHTARPMVSADITDFISQIPVHEASQVERQPSPQPVSQADSFESLESLESIGSDLYNDLNKVVITKRKPLVKKNVLPDLINFDAPSTSRFDDYHTMKSESDSVSIASTNQRSDYSQSTIQRSEYPTSEYSRSNSRVSQKSVLSLSDIRAMESKTKTEDSYVFEAGHILNLAVRYTDMKEYSRAFECYKAGIKKMLIGVQSDPDPQRRALIKQKTSKYLSYAEALYNEHLCGREQSPPSPTTPLHCPLPLPLLRRPYEELSQYRVLAVLGSTMMMVLHRTEQTCYAMKVVQKIPHNLTEFDEYFLQNTNETRQPVLPTVIPYMVPLQAYIETNNLIFLILAYAPGEKLFDYIKNYVKSIPNTPAREVNLENVFSEPKLHKNDVENENLEPKIIKLDANNENFDSIIEIKTEFDNKDLEISILERIEMNDNNNKTEITKVDNMETSELLKNSQNLLKNVDKVLSEVKVKENDEVKVNLPARAEDVKIEVTDDDREKDKVRHLDKVERRVETPVNNRLPSVRSPLPPSALSSWAAQILTALESLHNCGVICRDLNPSNILLGDQGQVILTYFMSYPGLEMSLAKLPTKTGDVNMYIAPELYRYTHLEERDEVLERVCDFWSFGAIMYELLCGVPLSHYHRGVFTSHTILQLPDGLPVEVQSLLTQLLTYEPGDRLGAGAGGVDDIKRHPYFKHTHWGDVYSSWKVPG